MWRYSPGMHASGRDTCYCWTRHGWKSLFVLQVLPDRDTATHTHVHNVLREPQMQRDAVALPAQQLSVMSSHFLLSALLFASKILLFSTFCRWPRLPTSKMDDPCLLFCCAIAGRASCIVWPCYFLIRLNLALLPSLKITSKNAPCWLMCAYLIGK